MCRKQLNEDERWIVLNALTTAKDEYKKIARTFDLRRDEGKRMHREFVRQAQDVARLYDLIEAADTIELRTPTECTHGSNDDV